MSLSREDAQAALRQVEDAESKVVVLTGYRRAAPQLMLWGVVWFFGYALSDLAPRQMGWIWLACDGVGFLLSYLIALRGPRRAGRMDYRSFAAVGVVVVFAGTIIAVLQPSSVERTAAFITALFALLYMLVGVWMGLRIFGVGLALFVLTIGGYFAIREHYLLWLAVTGGGTLLLSGLWLRRV